MYQALYRKKRPSTFKDIVEQQHIVTTLCNQLKGGHISHAYLFCGTRGTGKTTTAKVFARAVNCPESETTGEPCNTCEICMDILAERNLNVIEIDAASNNGVDNIRDLREEVKYPPSVGKYKVYIIDEVHMLTTSAFNALLKTLEEPPEQIIFILATTDPQKIPATILSRCQRYDFKRITREGMVNALAAYMEKENIAVERDALQYIASVSDGAMRDALSILDQCLSLYYGETITLEKVQSLLDAVDRSMLFSYGEALMRDDSASALAIIANTSKAGRDLSRFTADIITHFRNLLVAAQITNHTDILDYAPETVAQYRTQGQSIDPMTLIDYIKEFSELQNQMRYSSQERLALEVCTIKLCNRNKGTWVPPVQVQTQAPVKVEVATKPEIEMEPDIPADIVQETPKPPISVSIEEGPIESKENTGAFGEISEGWSSFCAQLSGLLKSMLALCKVECEDGSITILCRDQGSMNYMKDHKEQIAKDIANYFKLSEAPVIVFKVNAAYNNEDENKGKDAFKESMSSQINMPIDFE